MHREWGCSEPKSNPGWPWEVLLQLWLHPTLWPGLTSEKEGDNQEDGDVYRNPENPVEAPALSILLKDSTAYQKNLGIRTETKRR